MDEGIADALDFIAAKAKLLAYEYRNGKLWEGDLDRGLADINEALRNIPPEKR